MEDNRRSGFTLIEISVVLVIIGLLVGGILVGRDLIKAAELRKVISEEENLKTAVITFETKYNCIPGDCVNATAFFPAATNGDGNGLVGGFPHTQKAEMWQAPYQLAQAGLIAGTFTGVSCTSSLPAPDDGRCGIPGVNTPASVINKAGYTIVAWNSYAGADYSSPVMANFYGNAIIFGTTALFSNAPAAETYMPAIAAVEAWNIDQKVDDGLPASGVVLVSPAVAPNCVTSINPATALYNTTNTTIACGLFFMNQF